MQGNTEMIDQLVSAEALKSLDTLQAKLAGSYDGMERLLTKVQLLTTELSKPAKSYNELIKSIEKAEKAIDAKMKLEQEEVKTLQEIKKVTDDVIKSNKEQTKSVEEQEKATKKLEQTTKQLLAASERTAKGIDISAHIKVNEKGMKDYSGAINAVSQQMGIIEGLQGKLNEKLKEGAITETEHQKAMDGLNSKYADYEQRLVSLTDIYEKTGEAQRNVFNPASDAFASLSPEIQKQTVELVKMNEELKNIRTEQKELDKMYKDGAISLESYAKKKAELSTLESAQSNAVKALSKELQLNDKIANTVKGSYDNLSARYSLMKIEINALGEAEGQNAKQKRALEKEAKALYKQMNELQKATGKAQLQVGDYTLINRELEGAISTLNPAIGGTVSGIQKMTKAALTFIATPLGAVLALIVAGLAAVTSWFKRTEEGQSALSVATAAFNKVLSSLLNIVDKVGEWIYKAFTSPKQAIQELGDMIFDSFLVRFDALGKMGLAVIKIFSEDWKQGFRDLGDAALQALIGIEEPINRISAGMNDLLDGVQRAADIQSKMNDLSVKRRELTVEEAKSQAEMNRLRNIANDQEKTVAERLAANNKYIEISNNLNKKKADIDKENYELRKAQLEEEKKGSQLSIEEQEELAGLKAQMYKTAAEGEQMLYTATRTNNRLRKEGMNARNKELKALGELETFNYRKSADLQERLFKDTTLGYEERRDALRNYIDDEIVIIEKKAAEELKQEGLTEAGRKLIREKSLYEIFKLEQKYGEEIKNLNVSEAEDQVKQVQAIITERSEAMNEAMQHELVMAARVYEEQIKLNVNNEKERLQITDDYQRQRLEIIRKYNQEAFEFEVSQLEEALMKTELTEDQKLAIQKKIAELRKKNAKELADYEINLTEEKVDNMLTIEEKFNETLKDKRTDALMTMWGQAFDIMSMYYDAQLQKIDELEKREQEYWDNKLSAIDENLEAGLMSEDEAEARRRIIDESRLESEKEIERQRKEMQRKQAVWQKAQAVVQATINTAQAVTSALGVFPPPLGMALAAIVGALGAAQIAMIVGQQIPAYKDGTSNHPGGWAMVGDGGRSEMVVLPSGELWKTPARDTLAFLPQGTEVLPDYREAMMALSMATVSPIYDDRNGTVVSPDEVLRSNTKAMNEQLGSINRGIQIFRKNNSYFDSKTLTNKKTNRYEL